MVGYECSYVDAAPAREHVAALRGAGLGLRRITQLSGVARTTLQSLTSGCASRRGGDPTFRIGRETHDKLLSVPVPALGPASWRDASIPGGVSVDATGTVRRIRALIAFGHTRTRQAAEVGWTVSNFSGLIGPGVTVVRADTARKVAAMFGAWQLVPGPSTRARNEGRRNRWPLPMEWGEDDIDLPTARPIQRERHRKTVVFAEYYVDARDVLGLADEQIARRMGIEDESLNRQKSRHAECIAALRSAAALPVSEVSA